MSAVFHVVFSITWTAARSRQLFGQPVVVERVPCPLKQQNLYSVRSSVSCCFLFLCSAAAGVLLLFTSVFFGSHWLELLLCHYDLTAHIGGLISSFVSATPFVASPRLLSLWLTAIWGKASPKSCCVKKALGFGRPPWERERCWDSEVNRPRLYNRTPSWYLPLLSSSVIWKTILGQESRRDFQCRDGLKEFSLPVSFATGPSVVGWCSERAALIPV